jgi:hypothetical protein
LDDGVKEGEVSRVETGMGKVGFTGVNPVAVSAEGVDFAVMGKHAEGVGEGPSREGVRAIALVENCEGGFVGGVLKIQIKAFELRSREHALVDNDSGTKGRDVERRGAVGGASVFDFVAGKEKGEFEVIVREFFRIRTRDEKLFNPGGGQSSLFAENAGIDGDDPPTERN